MRDVRVSSVLLGAALILATAATVSGDENAVPPSSVRSELLQLLVADAKRAAAAKPAAAPAVKPAEVAPTPVVPSAPATVVGQPLDAELWNYFTDTGILASERGKKVTRELTFGPCTDGELLNQRYFW